MLVRISTMLLVRNPFPLQPIVTFVQTPSQSNSSVDQTISPNVTARSVNTFIHGDNEYNVASSSLSLQQDINDNSPSKDINLLDSVDDRYSANLDINLSQKSVPESTSDLNCISEVSNIVEIQEISETSKRPEVIEAPFLEQDQEDHILVQSHKLICEEVERLVEEPIKEIERLVEEPIEESVQGESLEQVSKLVKKEVQGEIKNEQVEVQKLVKLQEHQAETQEQQAEVQEQKLEVQEQKVEIQEQPQEEAILLDITQKPISYVPEVINLIENEEINNVPEKFESIFEKKVKDRIVGHNHFTEPIKTIPIEKSISSVYPRTLRDKSIPTYNDNIVPSASTTTPRKRYSLYAALGTRIHPRSSLDDSKGMPVFQAPVPTTTDKLKPKTMLKRIKTIVKNKKKSTTL